MIRRYTLPEMGAIWTEQARFEQMLRVELAVSRAQAARGAVPADALAAIEAGATTVQVYTGLVFGGPGIVGELTAGLAEALRTRRIELSALVGTA